MSLRIDIPSRKYSANDLVTGTVTLIGTEDIGVSRISITFSGRCKTKIVISRGNNSSSTYRARVPLFTFTKVLFTGPNTLHPNEHSWPFTFRFPDRCQVRGGDIFRAPEGLRQRFNNAPQQELPQSYNLFERGFHARKSGYVNYQLEATLIRDGSKIFASSSSSTTKYLPLIKPRKVAEPSPQMFETGKPFECHSLRLIPGNEERSLTLKEKLSSLSTKNVPNAKFKLVLRMPKVGVLGQALPLYLNVVHDLSSSSAPKPPTIYLKNASVILRQNGSLRCVDNDLFSSGRGERIETWDDDIVVSSVNLRSPITWAPMSPLNPRPDGTSDVDSVQDLREVMNLRLHGAPSSALSSLMSATLTPSFSTFNLEIHYCLRVKITIECAQKSFKSEFVSTNFELLAGEWAGHHGNTAEVSTISVDAPAYEEVGPPEILPPYARNPELWNPTASKGNLEYPEVG